MFKYHTLSPDTGFELWLSGNVDYAVIQYDEEMDNRGGSNYHILSLCKSLNSVPDHLMAPGGSRNDAFDTAQGRFMSLVQVKYQNSDQTLASYIPEAVSQAIALLKSAKYVDDFSPISSSEHHLSTFQSSRGSFLSIRWASMDVFYLEIRKWDTNMLRIGTASPKQRYY